MKKLTLTIALLILSITAGADETKTAAKTWEEKHSDKPYVTLLREYAVKLNDDWSYEETSHYRLKVQKDAAKDLGDQTIYYNQSREKILDIQAFVETPDGKKVPATEIQDFPVYEGMPMYSDIRVKVITLPQVGVGSIIDVTIKSKADRKTIPQQYWDIVSEPNVPTKYARYHYIFPTDKSIIFKAHNTNIQPKIEKKDSILEYTFEFNETDEAQDEEFMPPFDEVGGAIFFSSMDTWKPLADWYRDLINKNLSDDPAIVAKTKELIAGKTTQKEKARAILEFLQDNFRYVSMSMGDYMVEPHPTKQIFENRYGDCKDWSLLAKQMLALAGIESHMCLFSGEFDGNPQNGLPAASAFNHAILEVVVDGQKYFVEPQAKGYDFGQIPSGYDHAYVMVIDDKGFRFDHLPVADQKERSIVGTSNVYLKSDGSALFEVSLDLSLDVSQGFRDAWAANTDDNKEKFYEHLENTFTRGGKLLEKDLQGLDQRYGIVKMLLKFESPNAYPVVNDMIILKEEDKTTMPEFGAKERRYPIFIPGNSLMKNVLVYHVPEDLTVDHVPSDFKLGNDFMEVSEAYKRSEKSIDVTTQLQIRRALFPAERYAEVIDLRNQIYKKNAQYIILKKKTELSEAK